MNLPRLAEGLRKLALTYPETYEESPWGDRVVKVRGKIFLFCGVHDGQLYVTVKLPRSRREVLAEPFARPTAYGLGKSGWVTSTFARASAPPRERIAAWIDESYRALAPKKLVALAAPPAPLATPRRAATKPPEPKAPARRRALLWCRDPLRAERAERAFAARGLTVAVFPTAGGIRRHLKKVDVVIVDLGRLAEQGIALAAEIDASDAPIHLFLVGVRDAAARKRAQAAATSAELFRAPPGDPAVADAIVATLARYA